MYFLGEEINFVWAVLLTLTVVASIFGFGVNYIEWCLPQVLSDVFRYGKTSHPQTQQKFALLDALEIPKHWFSHFYMFASVYAGAAWLACAGVYLFKSPAPEWLLEFLDYWTTSSRKESTGSEATFLAMTLLCAQVRVNAAMKRV